MWTLASASGDRSSPLRVQLRPLRGPFGGCRTLGRRGCHVVSEEGRSPPSPGTLQGIDRLGCRRPDGQKANCEVANRLRQLRSDQPVRTTTRHGRSRSTACTRPSAPSPGDRGVTLATSRWRRPGGSSFATVEFCNKRRLHSSLERMTPHRARGRPQALPLAAHQRQDRGGVARMPAADVTTAVIRSSGLPPTELRPCLIHSAGTNRCRAIQSAGVSTKPRVAHRARRLPFTSAYRPKG